MSLQWSQVGPAVPLLTVSHANNAAPPTPERLSNSLVALAMENDVPPDKAIRGRAIRFGEQQHGV